MKRFEFGQTLGILANAGVIAGIVFLAIELQQNNEMMRAQTRGELTRELMDLLLENIDDSDFMDVVLRGDNGEELSALEAKQYENYLSAYLWHWQNIVYQNRMGMFDEEEFSVEMGIIRDLIIDRPGWTERWCMARYALSTEVIRAVEGEEFGEICSALVGA